MSISAALLERLLFDTEAKKAVAKISSMWQIRANPAAPKFGLSKVEYRVQLCVIYTGEVRDGGHAQFFANRGGRNVADTIEALTAVGLPDLGRTLTDAARALPGGTVPRDRKAAKEACTRLPGHAKGRLAQLDAVVRSADTDTPLLEYLRTRRGEVLVPELPLAKRASTRLW